jgi:hypothetical protein
MPFDDHPALLDQDTDQLPLYDQNFGCIREVHTDDHRVSHEPDDVLATDGVFCCTAIGVYDRQSGMRAASHTTPSSIDGNNDPEVEEIAEYLASDMQLEVRYLQGEHTAPAHHQASRETLHRSTEADLVEENTVDGDPSASIAVDSEGNWYRYDPRINYIQG